MTYTVPVAWHVLTFSLEPINTCIDGVDNWCFLSILWNTLDSLKLFNTENVNKYEYLKIGNKGVLIFYFNYNSSYKWKYIIIDV